MIFFCSSECGTGPEKRMIARSNQKDERWISNQSNSCGEFAFVASTVGASRFVSILGQLQLLQSPLNQLQDTKRE